MEYTETVGSLCKTYKGSPEEIDKLIRLQESANQPSKIAPPDLIIPKTRLLSHKVESDKERLAKGGER